MPSESGRRIDATRLQAAAVARKRRLAGKKAEEERLRRWKKQGGPILKPAHAYRHLVREDDKDEQAQG